MGWLTFKQLGGNACTSRMMGSAPHKEDLCAPQRHDQVMGEGSTSCLVQTR